ncbi:hypothetical protein BN946_scf184843.g20 [Trametes cinnabarina]|uniref:BTB domain-containing protein n=1 Tax=Pycnoporus cinnabarinus TaxID=5643 RepID=A0A060S7Z1_PYCCI|nr:hypothetical protein BN946_scf184843.g20 [Trametes cinnabarina]
MYSASGMSTDRTQGPIAAPAPFDKPSADIILRTSDRIDFRVHSQVLTLASPFFETMLSLPQPILQRSDENTKAEARAGADAQRSPGSSLIIAATHALPGFKSEDPSLPIIDVSEDSTTLELLLRILYPLPKPQMETVAALVPAVKAAQKYEMEWPLEILSERLVDIVRNPLTAPHVWAAACRTGLEDVARRAALSMRKSGNLNASLSAAAGFENAEAAALGFMEELGPMDGISAGDYFRLKRFLQADQAKIDDGSLLLLTPLPGEVSPVPSPSIPGSFHTDMSSTDVICRSRYGDPGASPASFYAHQSVLSVFSPVLKERLTDLRQATAHSHVPDAAPPPDTHPQPLVLMFEEDPDTLAELLSLCYNDDARLWSLDETASLLVAIKKYQMSKVERRPRDYWNQWATQFPLTVYLVATTCGLIPEAAAAAKLVLQLGQMGEYATKMETSSALAYHRLLKYHDSYRRLVRDQFTAAANKLPSSNIDIFVSRRGYNTSLRVDGVRSALLKDYPCGDRLRTEQELRQVLRDVISKSLVTQGWQEDGQGRAYAFVQAILEVIMTLPKKLEDEVGTIKLEFD